MKMLSPTSWKSMSGPSRIAAGAAALVQFTLLGLALWDLRRRNSSQVKGPKRLWQAVVFVNYIGPLAYFLLGRKG
jgi:hypothetical protein